MKGIIYKLFNEDKCYIGQTTQPIKTRMSDHKNDYKRFLKGVRRYCSSGEIIKDGNYNIECLEEIEYENKYDLLQLEKKYIRENICVNIKNNKS